jgi:hypothetical protein
METGKAGSYRRSWRAAGVTRKAYDLEPVWTTNSKAASTAYAHPPRKKQARDE